jgi:hypothetical protein
MTDERSPLAVERLRANGAVLVQDLLRPEDRRMFGWPIIFTDILALVEQAHLKKFDSRVADVLSQ